MKTVVITGGEGVLAGYVKKAFKNYKVFSPTHLELDITNKKSIETYFKKINPEIVVHLAAKTNVEECENFPQDAYLVNSDGTRNIALICKKTNAFMIYVSTAAVFEGKKRKNFETDIVNPVNVYGKSKLLGEKYVQEVLDNFLIVRAAWMIGGGMKEKKFVSYIIEKIKTSKEIHVVNDKVGTISYAKEFSEILVDLLEKKSKGIFHYGSSGVCSRYDIAKQIVSLLKAKVVLVPVPSSYFKTSFSAPRPENEILGSKRIPFPYTWRKSLAAYINNEIASQIT